MILTCPNCATKFRVKPGAIGPNGRKVKCRNCAHTWHAMPEDDDTGAAAPAPAKPAAPAPEPPPPPPQPAPEPDPTPAPPPPPAPEPEPDPIIDTQPDPDISSAISAGDPPEGMDPPPIPPSEDFVIKPRTPPKKQTKAPIMGWAIFVILVLSVLGGGFFFQRDITAAYPPMAKVYGIFGIEPQTIGYGLTPIPDTPTVEGRRLIVTGIVQSDQSERVDIPLMRGELKDTNGAILHSWTFRADKPDILPGESVRFSSEVEDLKPGAVNMEIRFEAEEMMDDMKDAMEEGGAMMQEGEGN